MIIKVAIVEDQGNTLNSLSILLNKAETLNVVGTFTSGEEAIEGIPAIKPHVALIDLGLPGVSGIEVIRELKGYLQSLEMLVFTVHEDKRHLFSALKAGASGYLLKDTTHREIIKAIEDIYNGSSPMSPKVARYVIEHFHGMDPEGYTKDPCLTGREKDILKGIADGLTDKQLADRFFISRHTVRTHIRNIYEKLHVHSKAEAVMKAMREGVL